MKFAKLIAAAAITAGLAAPAAAQVVMKSYDVNSDGKLTGAEFRGLFNDNLTLAAYDTDQDGFLSKAEYDEAFGDAEIIGDTSFGTYSYTDWDLNADGLVADEEYEQGFLTLYDADESGDIDETEFTTMEGEVSKIILR